jgi:hypothetical protein
MNPKGLTPVQQAVYSMIQVMNGLSKADTGSFISWRGRNWNGSSGYVMCKSLSRRNLAIFGNCIVRYSCTNSKFHLRTPSHIPFSVKVITPQNEPKDRPNLLLKCHSSLTAPSLAWLPASSSISPLSHRPNTLPPVPHLMPHLSRFWLSPSTLHLGPSRF